MNQYHKIQTIFKRDMANKGKIIEGTYSLPEFEYLANNSWVFTEKIDGTNIRVMWDGKDVCFGGKTDNAQIPNFLVNRLNELFYKISQKKIFKDVFGEEGGVCLYGEGYGAKIQKAGKDYISDGQDFILFDVKIGPLWLERDNVVDVASKFGIKVVPILGRGLLKDAIKIVKEGFNSQWGNFQAEGLVIRPEIELKNRRGHRIITKLKHRDFK